MCKHGHSPSVTLGARTCLRSCSERGESAQTWVATLSRLHSCQPCIPCWGGGGWWTAGKNDKVWATGAAPDTCLRQCQPGDGKEQCPGEQGTKFPGEGLLNVALEEGRGHSGESTEGSGGTWPKQGRGRCVWGGAGQGKSGCLGPLPGPEGQPNVLPTWVVGAQRSLSQRKCPAQVRKGKEIRKEADTTHQVRGTGSRQERRPGQGLQQQSGNLRMNVPMSGSTPPC